MRGFIGFSGRLRAAGSVLVWSASLALGTGADAQTEYDWINTSGLNALFTDGGNWDLGAAPSLADEVAVFDQAGDYQVHWSAGTGDTGSGHLWVEQGTARFVGLDGEYLHILNDSALIDGGTLVLDGSVDLLAQLGVTIGDTGTGVLEVVGPGGLLDLPGGRMVLGSTSTGDGTINLDGENTIATGLAWVVGDYGTGTVSVTEGAAVQTRSFTLGRRTGSTGSAVYQDATLSLDTFLGDTLAVGQFGTGTVEFDNTRVQTSITEIGQYHTSQGTVDLHGSESLWTNRSVFVIGGTEPEYTGSGGAGGSGQVTVRDGARLETERRMYIFGDGALDVESGGFVDIHDSLLLYSELRVTDTEPTTTDPDAAARGTVLTTGRTRVQVGSGSASTLHINNGTVVADQAVLGRGLGGEVEVTGSEARWLVDETVIAGTTSNVPDFFLLDGAQAITTRLYVGGKGTMHEMDGDLYIRGAGTVWVNGSEQDPGELGFVLGLQNHGNQATIWIEDGGELDTRHSSLRYSEQANTLGRVRIDGVGSIWRHGDLVMDGYSGQVIIENGGRLITNSAQLAFGPTSHASILVKAGSVWEIAEVAQIGNNDPGTANPRGLVSLSEGSRVLGDLEIGRYSELIGSGAVQGSVVNHGRIKPGSWYVPLTIEAGNDGYQQLATADYWLYYRADDNAPEPTEGELAQPTFTRLVIDGQVHAFGGRLLILPYVDVTTPLYTATEILSYTDTTLTPQEFRYDQIDGMLDVRGLDADQGLAVTYEPGRVLITPAYLGDANLDGVVDAGDLARLTIGWEAGHKVSWDEGDFDGDADADYDDLVRIQAGWSDSANFFATAGGLGVLPLGDANFDNAVDQQDLDLILAGFGTSTSAFDIGTGELTGDGRVDHADLNQVLRNWTATSTPSLTAPEPGTLLTWAWGLALLAHRRR